MTDQLLAARVFFFLLGIAGVGVACCGLRTYSRDAFRQRAFTARDRLFDYAATGHVPFSHPAYWRLRLAMNSMIRFSHRLTFGEAILPIMLQMALGRPLPATPSHDRWEQALRTLPSDVQADLKEFNREFGQLVASHFLASTPLVWPLVLLVAMTEGIRGIRTKIGERTAVLEEEALRGDHGTAALAA